MPRQSLRAITATRDPALVEILSRPSHYYADSCTCAECATRRAAPFVCRLCGYDGPPHMYPCHCARDRAQRVDLYRDELAHAGAAPWTAPLATVMDAIATLDAEEADTPCVPGTADCPHGARSCPVCGDHGDAEALADPLELVAIIRDLRATLHARGLV